MRSCPRCDGFVPAGLSSCPHCDAPAEVERALSLRGKLFAGVMASGTAMTLMACYGLPPCDDGGTNCYNDDFDGTADTGEACDGMSAAVVLEGDLPLMQSGQLQNESGSSMGTCGGSGDELVFQWTPPAAGNYQFTVDGGGLDVVFYVRQGVPEDCGNELSCVDDAGSGGGVSVKVSAWSW